MNPASCQDCKRDSSSAPASAIDGTCPMRMQDGRNFTDYHTRCSQLEQLRVNNDIRSSYDLRMYMQHNADMLMQMNRMASIQANNCAPCYINNGNGTMLPEQSLVECDEKLCRIVTNPRDNAAEGLGQGRNYNTVAPNSQPEMIYYPIEGISKSGYDRFGAV